MKTNETHPENFEHVPPKDFSHIKGWGIDADPQNDPTYPIKKRTDEEQRGYVWDRPEQQEVNVELLHSNERKNTPAVFGSTLPPEGLSGTLRRFGFQYSESDLRHWLSLMLADRFDVVEGIGSDIARGHIPNLIEELGLKAEWKYNRTNFLLKMAAAAAVVTAVVVLTSKSKGKKYRPLI